MRAKYFEIALLRTTPYQITAYDYPSITLRTGFVWGKLSSLLIWRIFVFRLE